MPVPIARDRHFRLSKNTVRFVVRNTVFQRKQGHKAEETRKEGGPFRLRAEGSLHDAAGDAADDGGAAAIGTSRSRKQAQACADFRSRSRIRSRLADLS
jgi:hypothetical protein